MSSAKLQAKVKAVNRANAEANRLRPILKAFWAQYVGKPILKQGGGILAKIEKLMPALPYDQPHLNGSVMVTKNPSAYSLSWNVRVCEHVQGERGCCYHETTLYIGSVPGLVLEKLEPDCDYRTDYTAEGVEKARTALRDAEHALSNAQSALYPFSRYDN